MKNIKLGLILFLILIICVHCSSEEQAATEPAQAGTITGILLDFTTGLPVNLANITTYLPTSAVTTDTTGVYTILNVLPQTYTVSAAKSGYYADSVKVAVIAGKTTTADIQLKQDSSLTIMF